MLKLFGFFISILLIVIIFLRMPQESMGLSSFASAQRSLNILTALGILIFFGIAIQLNLVNG